MLRFAGDIVVLTDREKSLHYILGIINFTMKYEYNMKKKQSKN